MGDALKDPAKDCGRQSNTEEIDGVLKKLGGSLNESPKSVTHKVCQNKHLARKRKKKKTNTQTEKKDRLGKRGWKESGKGGGRIREERGETNQGRKGGGGDISLSPAMQRRLLCFAKVFCLSSARIAKHLLRWM